MSFNIDIPFGSFEIYGDQLTLLVEHEMLGLDVAIEIAAFMDELDYFKDIDEDGFGWKSYNISFVFLHYYVA